MASPFQDDDESVDPAGDPSSLPLAVLREERNRLQQAEDAVSYVRRLAQGRLDLVRAEASRRREGVHLDVTSDLAEVLASRMAGGSSRPPRDTDVPEDHPLLGELDRRCEEFGYGALAELDLDALERLDAELDAFEHACSAERNALFERIDALTAELVGRYRDGTATVDGLLEP